MFPLHRCPGSAPGLLIDCPNRESDHIDIVKQVYKFTYPSGKIYIGKDLYGSHRYIGSPNPDIVNADFEKLTEEQRKDYTIRKQILWESENATERELSKKEVEMIRKYRANDPSVGYNRWPKFYPDEKDSE